MVVKELQIIPQSGIIDIELLSDIGFMEIFLNNGETVGTFFQPFNDLSNTKISVNSTNQNVIMNFLKIYEMKNIWNNK